MDGYENHSVNQRAKAALPPRARRLIERVRDLCEQRIQPALKRVLDEFDEQMFQLADQASNNTEQEICLAAQREVRRARSDLAPRFLSLLGDGFDHYHLADTQDAQTDPETSGLSLVGVDQQDEEVILNAAAARAELRSGMSLLELGYRFAALAGRPVVESDALPIGPRAMCSAWRLASSQLDLPAAQRGHLHRLFNQHLLQSAPSMFEAVNALMTKQGILPNLRTLLSRRSRGPDSANTSETPFTEEGGNHDHGDSNDHGTFESAQAAQTQSGGHVETSAAFSVLRGLLARRRHALGMQAQAPDPDAVSSSPQQLQAALSELQKQPATILDHGQTQLRSMSDLREDLQAQLRNQSDGDQPLTFNAEQTDTIDLVSMLFEHLGRDMPAQGQSATLMTQLQVPMLRVALSDPKFFSEHEHPARRLMGSVLETSMQWLDGAGEAADPVLARKLHNVVDRTAEEFDGNLELLDELRSDLDDQLKVLKRRAEISERRHLEAAQGRDRLQVARSRASELVAEKLENSDASGLLRTMLEQAWTDVLALSMLRWGERSKSFRDRLEVTDRLLRHKTESDDPELHQDIALGLSQVGIHGDEAAQIAARVIAPQAEVANDQNLTRTELAMRLKQRQRLGKSGEKSGPAESATPRVDPATQEAIERLRQLPFGSWLEFVRPDGNVVRRKLAWFSPNTGHCLVVNQRGAREDMATLADLGAAMAEGRVRLPQETSETILDRAWGAILGGLRKFAKTAAEQSA